MSEYRTIREPDPPKSYCMWYPHPHQRCNTPIASTERYCSAHQAACASQPSSESVESDGQKGTILLNQSGGVEAQGKLSRYGNPRAGTVMYDILGPEVAEELIHEALTARERKVDIDNDL
jgi:hypothetical protein